MEDLSPQDDLGVIIFLEGQLHNLKSYLNNLQIAVPITISLRSTVAVIASSFSLRTQRS